MARNSEVPVLMRRTVRTRLGGQMRIYAEPETQLWPFVSD